MTDRLTVAVLFLATSAAAGCRGEVLTEEGPGAQGQAATASGAGQDAGSAGAEVGSASTAAESGSGPAGAVDAQSAINPPVAHPHCAANVAPGTPLPIAGLPASFNIAADGTYVYAAEYSPNGVITRISPDDCTTTTLNPYGNTSGAGTFAVDGSRVYTPSGGLIVACSRGGCSGAPTTVANEPAWGLALYGGSIYFTGGNAARTVSVVPLSGGPATVLASGDTAYNLVVAGGNVIYATEPFAVKSVPLAGGSSTTLYASPDSYGVFSLVADAANVYAAVNDGNIVRIPLAGGQATTMATGQGGDVALAIDATNLYWGATTDSAGRVTTNNPVRKMALAGGPVTDLVVANPPANGVAVDDTYVYYTSGGMVFAVAK